MNSNKDYFEYSYTEIAERLNLTRNQVISIERTAFRKIKKILKRKSLDYDFFDIDYCLNQEEYTSLNKVIKTNK
jgi:hypothetical protein